MDESFVKRDLCTHPHTHTRTHTRTRAHARIITHSHSHLTRKTCMHAKRDVCVQNIIRQKKHFHLSREPFLCIQVSGTQVSEISMRAKRDVCVNVARKCDGRWGLSMIFNDPHLVDQTTPIWRLSTITLPCNVYAHVSLCTHRDLRDLCTRDVYAEKRLTRIWWLSSMIVDSDCRRWLSMMIVDDI